MSKITKKQKKLQELLEGFEQPTSGKEALTKLQEISKVVGQDVLSDSKACYFKVIFPCITQECHHGS